VPFLSPPSQFLLHSLCLRSHLSPLPRRSFVVQPEATLRYLRRAHHWVRPVVSCYLVPLSLTAFRLAYHVQHCQCGRLSLPTHKRLRLTTSGSCTFLAIARAARTCLLPVTGARDQPRQHTTAEALSHIVAPNPSASPKFTASPAFLYPTTSTATHRHHQCTMSAPRAPCLVGSRTSYPHSPVLQRYMNAVMLCSLFMCCDILYCSLQ
jgi:hypothetical protein